MSPEMQLLLVVVVGLVKAQESTPYNPDCLPYDGSVVPHCSEYTDPLSLVEHSSSKLNI